MTFYNKVNLRLFLLVQIIRTKYKVHKTFKKDVFDDQTWESNLFSNYFLHLKIDRISTLAHMFMWRTCLCGEHVYVANMFMWRTCLCGEHVYVANMFMWRTCLCGEHVYVANMFMWRTCLCGEHAYVVNMYM